MAHKRGKMEAESDPRRLSDKASTLYTKTLIDKSSTTVLLYEATCFELFKWSSSGLLTDPVNRYCVNVGIPICLHR